jgi:hypothetical protein
LKNDKKVDYKNFPKSIMTEKKLENIFTIPIIELARQITLIEFENFKNIKVTELLDMEWTRKRGM